jgi:hypothetical protein
MSSASYRWAVRSEVAVGCIWLAGPAVSKETQKAPDTRHLTDANFPIIFDALQPPKVEPWKSIPWHISIVEAARQAGTGDIPGCVPLSLKRRSTGDPRPYPPGVPGPGSGNCQGTRTRSVGRPGS